MKNIKEMSDEQLDSEIEEYSGLVEVQQELSRKGLLLPRSGISTISEEDASHTGILRQYVWDLKDERKRRLVNLHTGRAVPFTCSPRQLAEARFVADATSNGFTEQQAYWLFKII